MNYWERRTLLRGTGVALAGAMAVSVLGCSSKSTPKSGSAVTPRAALRVAEQASRAGVDVTLHVQPGGFHVYPLFVPDAPESRHAMEAIANFIQVRA
jgi:acetyl esterase/lipase